MLKMFKISRFKQNQCISGIPLGIPMQFFPQHWFKSRCCVQFHTYSQWFEAKLIFANFSIAGKCSSCLKYAVLSCFKQNYHASGLPKVISIEFYAKQW